mgnify:CR=1 FL=1
MTKVHVALNDRSYDIHIDTGLTTALSEYVPADLAGKSLFVLTDENVSMPHAGAVYEHLKSCRGESVQLLALPPGEETKSFAYLEKVMAWLLDHGVTRQSVLFAVGGGVIGDLGGLAAALAMRGIACVQVPTTLLAQVDSSVGGKTAINMLQGKNMVGAFYQPCSVICDLGTLTTLPRREVLAGYAEIVKYGLINDPEFFIWLEKEGEAVCNLDEKALKKAIEISCRKKAEIVAEDERESGARALLNLGHTFGHALEAACGYDGQKLLHGEAVAIGMVMAARLSVRMGILAENEADRIENHLAGTGLPVKAGMIFPPLDKTAAEIYDYMKHDKKVADSRIRFILLHDIGKAFISNDVERDDVLKIIEDSLEGH